MKALFILGAAAVALVLFSRRGAIPGAFPTSVHNAAMAHINTKFPGAQITFRDMNWGFRWYGIKTAAGVEHQIVYAADGTVHSQS